MTSVFNEVRDSIFHLGVISDQLSAEVLRISLITRKVMKIKQNNAECEVCFEEILKEVETLINLSDWVEEVSLQLKNAQSNLKKFKLANF